MTRVLIVDDDESSREAMHAVLDDAGYEVIECGNGLACLAILSASCEPLVVLLDYRMPRMSGAEVLRVAAERKLADRHSFVLLTASPHELDFSPFQIPAGLVIPIVGKPFDIDDLVDTVADAARRLRLEAEDAR
jgi:CheY-like chemotaxis protein